MEEWVRMCESVGGHDNGEEQRNCRKRRDQVASAVGNEDGEDD